jgi:hypothetical protein
MSVCGGCVDEVDVGEDGADGEVGLVCVGGGVVVVRRASIGVLSGRYDLALM